MRSKRERGEERGWMEEKEGEKGGAALCTSMCPHTRTLALALVDQCGSTKGQNGA